MDARSLRRDATFGGKAAHVVMWSGIAASVLLLLVFLALGRSGDAWKTAAALLLVLCVATCIWAGIADHRSARDVERALDRLVTVRREAQRSSATRSSATRSSATREGGTS